MWYKHGPWYASGWSNGGLIVYLFVCLYYVYFYLFILIFNFIFSLLYLTELSAFLQVKGVEQELDAEDEDVALSGQMD